MNILHNTLVVGGPDRDREIDQYSFQFGNILSSFQKDNHNNYNNYNLVININYNRILTIISQIVILCNLELYSDVQNTFDLISENTREYPSIDYLIIELHKLSLDYQMKSTHISTLDAISPIDGRYRAKTGDMDCFSEASLIATRVVVEINYLLFMIDILNIPIPEGFSNFITEDYFSDLTNVEKIKDLELITNHDVKAVELHIRNSIAEKYPNETRILNLIHFGLTSEDVNSSAYSLMTRKACQIIDTELQSLINQISSFSENIHSRTHMLSRTHGQPAYPTTFSRELKVFLYRFRNEIDSLSTLKWSCKFGGAIGSLLDHKIVLPDINWEHAMNTFTTQYLDLQRQKKTTQIENYTVFCNRLDHYKRIGNIIRDFCQDMWLYISCDYLKLKIIGTETGSSVMAHKINPIHFENAIGNIRMATSIFETLVRDLPVSMLQRDLTGSTMLRNLGTAFSHLLIAVKSSRTGFERIALNSEKMESDLHKNWQVFSGVYQNYLRIHAPEIQDPYSLFKDFTRDGKSKTKNDMISFLKTIPTSEENIRKIISLDPLTY